MTPEAFVRELDAQNQTALDRIAALSSAGDLGEERHHHELGRAPLLALATTEDAQEAARVASAKVLAMAEELQEIARLGAGISRAPGC